MTLTGILIAAGILAAYLLALCAVALLSGATR